MGEQKSDARDEPKNRKIEQLDSFREEDADGRFLTTNQGVRVSHTDDSLKAGERGPTLMEDFHLREKMMHFDHESIPERVVHARGAGAHGYFQVYDSMEKYTTAGFLNDPSRQTPVFVRFSTVVGSRGSSDTVRDVRGFATKFYTDEGVFDLVANNMPVFFIQDGNKFPDLVHAIKPEPHNEIPQATAAHDTFWDFISLMPESAHMIMWLMSDRGIPRSFRMMEGFGVNTFRFVNKKGKAHFIKWHWKPVEGTAALVWDEAQKLSGKDADWLRRDLWDAIEGGDYPEFELGVQMVPEKDEHKFDFDLLDATKIIPEDEVPVKLIGKMVLNRNPDNFFAETEQVAFHPGHVVPGIDFTNDPLLQGRLFSYLDTQLNRFGGANFHEVPINRPLAPVNNNQGAGFMRMGIRKGRVSYFPNSLGGGCPMTAGPDQGGFVHYMEKVDGRKVKGRSESFKDHFSQATMFWNSLSSDEQEHVVSALHFEIGKVETFDVRHRMVHEFLNHIDHDLATRTAKGIGVEPPKKFAGKKNKKKAPEVGIEFRMRRDTIKTQRVAIALADGFDYKQLSAVKEMLTAGGAKPTVVSLFRGTVKSSTGEEVEVDKSHVTTASVMFDALYIPGGKASVEAQSELGDAMHFIQEMFKHAKPIGASGEAVQLIEKAYLPGIDVEKPKTTKTLGVILSEDGTSKSFLTDFKEAIAMKRFFMRKQSPMVPA